MKKEFNFAGNLLFANKTLANGAWHTIAIYTGTKGKVSVIVFDCDKAEQISEKIKELILVLEKKPTLARHEKKNLDFLKELDEKISSGKQQEIPKQLLSSVKRNFTVIEKEYCIFLPKE